MPLPLALLGGFLARQALMAGGRAIAGRAIQSGATRLAGRYLGNNAAGAVSKVIGVGRGVMAGKSAKAAYKGYKQIKELPGEIAKKALDKKEKEDEPQQQQEESTDIRNKFYSELDDLISIPEGNQGKGARLRGLRRMKKQNKQEVVESTDKIEELSKKTLQGYIKKAVQYVRSSTPAGEKTIYKGGTGGTDKPEAIGTRKGKLRKVRGSQIHKAQKKADAQVENTDYLRGRIFKIVEDAQGDISMTQRWLSALAKRGASAVGSLGSGLVQGVRKGYTHSFGSGGREGRWGGTPIDVKKDGLLNTGSQLIGRGVGYAASKLGKQAVTGAKTLKAGFEQGKEKAKSSAILPQSRQGSWGGQIDWKGNLASNLGKLAGRGAGWLYGKATKKHDILSKKPSATPQAPQAPSFVPQNRDQRLQKRRDILNARRSGRLAQKGEIESDRDRLIGGNVSDSTNYRDMFLQSLSNMLFEAKKSGREIRKERQEKRRHAMTQMKHMKQTGMGWAKAADDETAERKFHGFMKGALAKLTKSRNRPAQKQEESTMDIYDRIVNILLEARVEDYLDSLNEARRGGSVEKLRYKLRLGIKSDPADKKSDIGRGARSMDAALMRMARNPNSKEAQARAKTNREIHRDARSSEESPSRGGRSRRPSEEEHGSLTAGERNYGDRSFNPSRTGY